MITVIRNRHNTYCVIDEVYDDGKIQFEQSNLNTSNRFGAKEFKTKNGKTLNVTHWSWGVKK